MCDTYAIPGDLQWWGGGSGGDQADLDHLTPSTQSPRYDSETSLIPLRHVCGSPEKQMAKRFYHTDSRTPARHQCRITLIPAPWLPPRAVWRFRPTILIRKQPPHPQIQMLTWCPCFLSSSACLPSGKEIAEINSGEPHLPIFHTMHTLVLDRRQVRVITR